MSGRDHGPDPRLGEGGDTSADVARTRLVAAVARAGDAERGDLWVTAVAEYGEDGASRIWQEALSAGDASET